MKGNGWDAGDRPRRQDDIRPEEDDRAAGRQKREKEVRAALGQALRWLSVHDRSRAEIEHRLARRGLATDACQEALDTLVRWGYLDDERYIRQWVTQSFARGRAGKDRLRLELISRGLPRALVERVLAEVSAQGELAAALQAAHRWVRLDERNESEQSRSRRRANRPLRLWQYLSRKGFSPAVVRKAVDQTIRPGSPSASDDPEGFVDTSDGES